MPKKKRKKWCFQQARNPSNQSLLSHPAFLTTKCGFFGEHDLWHSEEKCFAGEQMSLLRCHSTAFQCGQDGSVLEVHEEKILCPERMASVLPLRYWRREVLRLGKVSCLSFPAAFFPMERRRKPRPAACFCACADVRATPTATGLQYAKNVFLSFSLPTVALADNLFCLLLTVISPGACCFSSLLGSDMALLF